MKFIFALLVACLAIASVSANFDVCGPHQCEIGHSCVCDNGQYRCVYYCGDVIVTQKVVSRWSDNNGQQPYTQVEVTIRNASHKNVKNVVLGTQNMNLKDNNAIWSITRLSNGNLVLPTYVTKLSPGQTHTFGYINKGNNPANIYVKYVDLF
ncbi:cellulose-binding domain-containing protein [Tieghemostelium lacteum]|uniref:Cellulose-binding domain-containing protein n=1 Tax=Tieghemostelium lacteum TaxID=361077 RepID=A0A152A7Y0_TIELA|nr:cellulose-binding domain-containing protein [Tieghemostelium lacteum]|eukprot:KYR02350.1 cellulose-binding domain-containing protein [Tieghemostelium lacteum]